MKVAFVTPRYPPHIGGIEKHVKEIAERLAKNHDVEVFTLDDTDSSSDTVENGVKVKRFKPISLSKVMQVPPSSMVAELKSSKADIVHAHGIQNVLPYFAYRGVGKSKFVVTSHYSGTNFGEFRKILFRVYKPFLNRALHRTDHIVCVSNFEKEAIAKQFNVEYGRISVIPNGVEKFTAENVKTSPGEFRIMFAGRLDFASKNVDKLIKAFAFLDRKDAKLVLVGNGVDRERVLKMIGQYHLQDRVEVITNPSKKQLAEEYCRANLFVMPSMHECFAMAAAEALSTGVTTIVTNSTAMMDFVSQRYAYGIEPPVTPEKIADAIKRVTIGDIQFNKYSGYSWDAVSNSLEVLYNNLLHK
ncbi:MAG: glycosyltransferase involved in cell wall biosynthesis [Candidatus Nitrosomirales archaeon]|jgi:glycosyltransferase involved in cell wall biosynthesis